MSETTLEPASQNEEADQGPAGKPAFRGRRVDDSWKKIQERTFKNWMNDRLRGNLKVAKVQVPQT